MIASAKVLVTESVNPFHNLALEELLLEQEQPGELTLYLWQNQQTVVIGRNQNAWGECRVEQLERDGGHLARRLSGGGAVFHDLGNLNFTFLLQEDDYDVARQLAVIVQAVRSFGLPAEATGRNDITVEGRKFSGNAFYKTGKNCYHHGTLLLNADRQALSRYLQVSQEKLRSKGVQSVQSRVVNLCELCPAITLAGMKTALTQALQEVYGVVPQLLQEEALDSRELKAREERFASWEWRFGREIPFTTEKHARFSWGELTLQLEVQSGVIADCRAFSDAMDQDTILLLPRLLTGCRLRQADIDKALSAMPQETMKEDIRSLFL